MNRLPAVQLAGICVCAIVLAADQVAALALWYWPNSPTMWWISLELLSFLKLGQHPASPVRPLFSEGSAALAAGIISLALLAYYHRSRLVLAILSNCCFIAVLGLAYSVFAQFGTSEMASLAPRAVLFDWDGAAASILAGIALAAFMCSHLSYLRSFVSDAMSDR